MNFNTAHVFLIDKTTLINPLPDDKSFALSKLKVFADDKSDVIKKLTCFSLG